MSALFLRKLINWLRRNGLDIFLILILLSAVVFISYKNYVPNTWLSGWDNLHPEFNFKLNIVRSLNTAWQEYQGLGLLGGMAHAADLPRQLFLWLISVFVPVSFVRYFWTFLMLGIGPLGAYFLIKSLSSRVGGFAGAVFYLLNLATVQYFYVPFETFVGFFGFLPWLLYFAVGYVKTGRKLITYFLISILATCAFYVQTLFLIYMLFLFILCLDAVFKYKKDGVLRSIKLFLVTFGVNVFWLLPVIWFSLTSGQIPVNSQINRIASFETVYMNQARGDFLSVANLKGYWFDYYDFSKNGQFDYLFADWISHTNNIWVERTGVFLFAAAILGLIVRRKFAWLIVFGVAYLMLTGFKFPLPILAEAFRNSFTKWSVALALVISLGLGAFVSRFRKFSIVPAILVIGACVFLISPVFKGKLISGRMKVDIPNEYFTLLKWFETKPQEGRVAFFPFFNFWGWNYHSWGYDGSGFLWYGIRQPVLDRAFNVWSAHNDTYQNEISSSLYNQDAVGFGNVLRKFQVKYLLLDESVIYPGGDQKLLFVPEIKKMFSDLNYQPVFKDVFLTVYETPYETNKFVSTPQTYTAVNADLTYSSSDPIYAKYGNYISEPISDIRHPASAVSYPFVNFDPRGPVTIKISNDKLQITNEGQNAKVTLPVDNKITETFGPDRGFKEVYNCDLKKTGTVSRENLIGKRVYQAGNGGVACDYFDYSSLKSEQAYVLKIKGENIQGRSLKVYFQNWATNRMDLEELLPEGKFDSYFVVFGGPHTLNIETRSFGRIASENVIESIELYPFDINFLTDLTQNSEKLLTRINNLKILSVKKTGTAFYKVKTEGEGLLELGQGYDEGWMAFEMSNVKLRMTNVKPLEHIKVSSWANGWLIRPSDILNPTSYIYIIFWPQLLEWAGMTIGLAVLIYLLVDKPRG